MMLKFILTSFLFCLCLFAFPQENQRPKVGLVLSGGGAKGLAHIGVLKVLEEEGVQVDYIAGTSMGAIIGGLYASGYTANQLDSIFKSVDADALLQDYIPRNSKSFYEKRNDEIYALQLPFDQFKIGSPVSLSKGMYNYNLLNKLLAHVRYENDFAQLPIPFLCVATDVVTGEAVVLEKGNLAQSILASGAFPSLYTPVEIDNRLLIDGGVVNNYPINELRDKGVDVIIGVDVQDGKKDRSEIKGVFDILMQIANYSMYQGMEEKKNATDIYMKPDISNFSVVTFDKGNEIIQKGIDAAREKTADLQKISNGYTKKKLPEYLLHDDLAIKEVKINTLKNYNKDYVFGKLGYFKEQCVSFNELKHGITNLNATQNFSSINYHFEKGDDTGDYLVLHLKENTINRFLKFGLHFDNLYKSAALVNITQKKLLFKNDVASLDFVFGDNVRYNFNYFIDNGLRWSFGAQSRLNKFKYNVLTDEKPIITDQFFTLETFSTKFTDLTNRLYLQNYYNNKFLIGLGLEHKYQIVDISNVNLSKNWLDNSHYVSSYFNVVLDTYDNKYFPTQGLNFNAEIKHTFISSDYNENFEPFTQINGELGTVKTFFDRISFEAKADVGLTIGSLPSTNLNYFLGGYGFQSISNIKPFFGYDFLSLNANTYLKALLRVDYRFYKKHHLNFTANYIHLQNAMFQYNDWLEQPIKSGYALGYGFQTVIGPLEIKQSYSPEVKKHYTWFSLGFWF
ncbi:patatin-like phospholipase family protein [Flavobacterium sp. CBA20B-1]|uniref:patatin-like phospholipase family protein n=1 Tax=unclassified Flavobacterium TaxID=196869 RepID=UPI0022243403|nr:MULTISPECIES: patatin-like phospholipase family protein [unclassified Flavobacterium]WCM41087.1 patatin-like phospholipase family protein [Flavobacterium sp. CBA20B-1]